MSYIFLPFGEDFSGAHAFYQDNKELLKNQYGDLWLAIGNDKVLDSNVDEHDLYNQMVVEYGHPSSLELVPVSHTVTINGELIKWTVEDGIYWGRSSVWCVLFVQAIDGDFVEHKFSDYNYSDDWER